MIYYVSEEVSTSDMIQAMNVILVLLWLSFEAAGAPSVFYTDLDRGPSAPKNGGSGAFITIFGNRFGDSQGEGTLTIGGVPPASYLSWSNTKIVVRLGTQNRPGRDLRIVVTVRGERSNQDVLFTIDNAHRIYYFDPNAGGSRRDNCSHPAKGSESSPWRYLRQPLSPRDATYYVNNCMGNGDILYFRAGTVDTRDGTGLQHSVLLFDLNRRGITWLAVAAYPGEAVILDGSHDSQIRETITSNGFGTGIVVAGLQLIGGVLNVMPGMPAGRIVGNLITGPDSCNYAALGMASTKGGMIFGNEIRDVGTNCNSGQGPTKLMHSMYMKCNGCEIGWNYLHGNKTYNGIQFHDDHLANTAGYYNISIHDNWIQGQYGSGINLSTIDFPTGSEYVRVYNNVLYQEGAVARAHWENGGGQAKSCIALKDYGRKAAKGTVEVYNNTMADCTGIFNDETWGGTAYSGAVYKGGAQTGVTLQLGNNITYAPPYYWTDPARGAKQQSAYIATATATCCAAQISGTNNLWYGFGEGPGSFTANVNANAMFTMLPVPDFHPREGNPVLGNGIRVPWIQTDRDGVLRPSHPAIGAYEAVP